MVLRGAHGDTDYYTIISLENRKKLNNDFSEDLVDYNEENKEFKEFLKKEFIEYHKDITEANERFEDFYFFHSEIFFIFNNDGTIDIYNAHLPTVVRVYRKTKIEMKKLKPYVKKDSFYRYLFD